MNDKDIQSAEDIPEIDDVGHLREKLEQVKELRKGGEGWYDACLRVGDNDAQKFVLAHLVVRQVKDSHD